VRVRKDRLQSRRDYMTMARSSRKTKKELKARDRDLSIKIENDPLLALRGSGKDLWADEHADEYVRRLREGWDEAADLREGLKPPADPADGSHE
jgi:hypothetical protein